MTPQTEHFAMKAVVNDEEAFVDDPSNNGARVVESLKNEVESQPAMANSMAEDNVVDKKEERLSKHDQNLKDFMLDQDGKNNFVGVELAPRNGDNKVRAYMNSGNSSGKNTHWGNGKVMAQKAGGRDMSVVESAAGSDIMRGLNGELATCKTYEDKLAHLQNQKENPDNFALFLGKRFETPARRSRKRPGLSQFNFANMSEVDAAWRREKEERQLHGIGEEFTVERKKEVFVAVVDAFVKRIKLNMKKEAAAKAADSDSSSGGSDRAAENGKQPAEAPRPKRPRKPTRKVLENNEEREARAAAAKNRSTTPMQKRQKAGEAIEAGESTSLSKQDPPRRKRKISAKAGRTIIDGDAKGLSKQEPPSQPLRKVSSNKEAGDECNENGRAAAEYSVTNTKVEKKCDVRGTLDARANPKKMQQKQLSRQCKEEMNARPGEEARLSVPDIGARAKAQTKVQQKQPSTKREEKTRADPGKKARPTSSDAAGLEVKAHTPNWQEQPKAERREEKVEFDAEKETRPPQVAVAVASKSRDSVADVAATLMMMAKAAPKQIAWQCDCCKKAAFDSYDECVVHEEICRETLGDLPSNGAARTNRNASEASSRETSAPNDNGGGDGKRWQLKKVLSASEILSPRARRCEMPECNNVACCVFVWPSDKEDSKVLCLDCLANIFGGWPAKAELPINVFGRDWREAVLEKCTCSTEPDLPSDLASSIGAHVNEESALRIDGGYDDYEGADEFEGLDEFEGIDKFEAGECVGAEAGGNPTDSDYAADEIGCVTRMLSLMSRCKRPAPVVHPQTSSQAKIARVSEDSCGEPGNGVIIMNDRFTQLKSETAGLEKKISALEAELAREKKASSVKDAQIEALRAQLGCEKS